MAFETKSGLTEESTSRTIQVDGINIHYHDIGEGEPIIFLHSYGPGVTSWITFFKVVEAFAAKYRCILFDMPNFGKTGPVVYEDTVHGIQAKVAVKLAEALNIASAIWIGNSQGGQSALLVALEHPEYVRRLVLGGAHAYLPRPLFENPLGEGEKARNAVLADPTRENFRRFLQVHIHDETLITEELVDYLRHWHTWSPEFEAARRESKVVSGPSHTSELEKVRAPTLIVQGRYDRRVSFEYAIGLLNHLPDSRLVLLRDANHWIPFEKPVEYSDFVLTFLASPLDTG